jgi:choline-glycine betaine transporter
VNASAYSIATVASKDMTEGTDVEPHLSNRIIWVIFLGAIALALMYQDQVVTQATGPGTTSVLTALKVSSLAVALPLMVCIFIAVLSFLKWIREDKPHLQKGTTQGGES